VPIITRFSPRLARALRHMSREVKKPYLVKTNPVLERFIETPLTLALPEKHASHSRLPIYVSPTDFNLESADKLTPRAEYSIAYDAASYLSYIVGYRRSEFRVFAVNVDVERIFGKKVLEVLKYQLIECFDEAFSLTSSFMANSIVSSFGYDPAKEHYEEWFVEFIHDKKSTFTNEAIINLGSKIGLNMQENPEMARLMVFDGIIRLAKLYLFMPEYYREELIRNVGSFWRDHLIFFLQKTELELDYPFLIGPDFQRYYSVNRHERALSDIFNYICGTKSHVSILSATDQEMDDRNIKAAREAFDSVDFIGAFHFYSEVTHRDVTEEMAKAWKAMVRSVSAQHPELKLKQVYGCIMAELASRGSVESTIDFQERAYGMDADLDAVCSFPYE